MISVIIPVYNVGKYIEKTLESVVNQDYKDFELLLVNDGSTDNSVDVASTYLSKKNINWRIINKDNGGQSSARNMGLDKANGDYVVFLDSDDVVSEKFLSSLYKEMKEDVDFTFCNYEYVKNQIPPIDNKDLVHCFNQDELLEVFLKRKINFVLPSMMFKRDFLVTNNLYLNENIKFSEDQMFIWDVIFKANKSVYLYSKMYGYYLREKSIMTSSPYNKIQKGFEEYCEFIKRLKQNYKNKLDIIKYILPRWELGTLYSSAKLLNKKEYINLYNKFDGKNILNEIKGMNDRNSSILAFIAWLSPSLLYFLCRKVNLSE